MIQESSTSCFCRPSTPQQSLNSLQTLQPEYTTAVPTGRPQSREEPRRQLEFLRFFRNFEGAEGSQSMSPTFLSKRVPDVLNS